MNHFSFVPVNQKDPDILTFYCNRLKDIHEELLANSDIMLIITDTSIKKNNVAISISYICRGQEIITKLVYYAINITFIEAELFAIRYRINHIVTLLISSLSLIPF